MTTISRRGLLAGAAATPVVGRDSGDNADPMIGLCKEWHEAWQESERCFAERVRLHRELTARIGKAPPAFWDAEAVACGLAAAEEREVAADARFEVALRAVMAGSAATVCGVVAKLGVAATFGADEDDLPWVFLRGALEDLRGMRGA